MTIIRNKVKAAIKNKLDLNLIEDRKAFNLIVNKSITDFIKTYRKKIALAYYIMQASEEDIIKRIPVMLSKTNNIKRGEKIVLLEISSYSYIEKSKKLIYRFNNSAIIRTGRKISDTMLSDEITIIYKFDFKKMEEEIFICKDRSFNSNDNDKEEQLNDMNIDEEEFYNTYMDSLEP